LPNACDSTRGARHQGRGLIFLRKIALERCGLHASGTGFRRRTFGILGRAVIVNRHVPARRRQVQGDGTPQPLRRAGDQNIFHGRTPDAFATLGWSMLFLK
jgi:hypothetical protein